MQMRCSCRPGHPVASSDVRFPNLPKNGDKRGPTWFSSPAPILAAMVLAGLSILATPRPALAGENPVTIQPVTVPRNAPSYLEADLGAFNIRGSEDHDAAMVGEAEFRYGRRRLFLGPVAGIVANTQGAVFGYIGIYTDIFVGRHIVITPLAGLGGYDRGSSLDLGGTFAFRLSAELAYQFDNQSRAGLKFGHISNAGLYAKDPGEDELLVSYSVPLRF